MSRTCFSRAAWLWYTKKHPGKAQVKMSEVGFAWAAPITGSYVLSWLYINVESSISFSSSSESLVSSLRVKA